MAKQITSAAVLMAALAVLVGAVATGGCLPERSQWPATWPQGRRPARPHFRPQCRRKSCLPCPLRSSRLQPLGAAHRRRAAGSPAPLPPEEQPPASLTVPSLSLPSGEQEHAATEVLTSGPVHEAFAEPVDLQPEPGLVVPQEPPADIQEVPAGRPARRRRRRLGARLLGLGRGPRRLRLGQRLLARGPAGHALGARILGAGARRLAVGERLLAAGGRGRGGLPRRRRRRCRTWSRPAPHPPRRASGCPPAPIGSTTATSCGAATG